MKPNGKNSLTAEKVPFGYREVTPTEKKRLVQEQFDPIAQTYDLADTVLSFGLDSRWRKKAVRLLGLEEGTLSSTSAAERRAWQDLPLAGSAPTAEP